MSPVFDPSRLDETQRRRIVVGVLIAMLLAALDQTIVAPALPTIGKDLGNVSYLSWVVSAYFLLSTAVTPLYGKLADLHGRHRVLSAAICMFLAGSVLCALSRSMLALIIGRAVQGLGGGGLMVLAQTVIGDIVPPKERGRYSAFISATWATASVLGPVVGGILAEHLHWSMIFWINLPLGLLAIAITSRTLSRMPFARRDHRLDVPGAVLLSSATVTLLLALTWGGTRYAWDSPAIVGLIGGALLLGLAFVWRLGQAEEPLIPVAVLRNRIVRAAVLSVFFSMAAYIGVTVYLPLYLQLVLGLSASSAGLALVGFMIGTVVGATTSGRLMGRLTHYKRLPFAGLVLSVVSLALLTAVASRIGVAGCVALTVLTGLGIGPLFPVTTVSVQNAVAPRDLGTATGVLGFMRALGVTIGVAVLGAVAGSHGLLGGAASEGAASALTTATGAQFAPVFAVCALSCVLSLLFLATMEEKPLRSGADRAAEAAPSPAAE